MTFCVKSGGVIFSRIIPGGIQLLRSLLRESRVHQNANVYKPGEGVGQMPVRMFVFKFMKGLSRPSKRRRNTEMGRNCG